MSSGGFETAREFAIKPSPRLLMLAAAAHLVAIILPWLVLTWAWAVGLNLLLAASYASLYARQYAGRAVHRVQRLSDGRWRLLRRDGSVFEGVLAPTCYVSVGVVILNVRSGWRRRSVVILPDAMAAADRRRLRVHLRWSISGQPA